MVKRENFYEKFKINSNVTESEIQKVYRALIRKYHPDVFKGQNAEQKTKRVNEIYEVLSDPVKRAEHDAFFGFGPQNVYVYQKKQKSATGAVKTNTNTAASTGGKSAKSGGKPGSGTTRATSATAAAKTRTVAAGKTMDGDAQEEARLLRELAELSELLNLAEEEKRAELQAKIDKIDRKIAKMQEAAKKAAGNKTKTAAGQKTKATAKQAEGKTGDKAKPSTKKKPTVKKTEQQSSAASKSVQTDEPSEKSASSDGMMQSKPKSKSQSKAKPKSKTEQQPNAQSVTDTEFKNKVNPDPKTESDSDAEAELYAANAITDEERVQEAVKQDDLKGTFADNAKDVPAGTEHEDKVASVNDPMDSGVAIVIVGDAANIEKELPQEQPKQGSGSKSKKGKQSGKGAGNKNAAQKPEQSQAPQQDAGVLDDASDFVSAQNSDTESNVIFIPPMPCADGQDSDTADERESQHTTEVCEASVKSEQPPEEETATSHLFPSGYAQKQTTETQGKTRRKESKSGASFVTTIVLCVLLLAMGFYTACSTYVAVTGDAEAMGGIFRYMSPSVDAQLHTVTYAAGEGGSIQGETEQSIKKGESGTPVTAVPENQYWYFISWSDGVENAVRYEKNVTEAVNLTAQFQQYLVVSYVAADENGTVVGDIVGGAEQLLTPDGSGASAVAAIATDPYAYDFFGWFVDGVKVSDEPTHTPDAALAGKTVTARFLSRSATVFTVRYETEGKGYLIGQTTQRVPQGEGGTPVTAVPQNGYYFVGWFDTKENPILNLADAEQHIPQSVSENMVLVARFAPYLTVTCIIEGAGAVQNEVQQIKYGQDSLELVAAPLHEDYYFAGWFDVDGNAIEPNETNENSLILKQMTDDVSIRARFYRYVTVRYVVEGEGTVTNALQKLKIGENGVQVVAEPRDEQHYFAGWFDLSGQPVSVSVDGNKHIAQAIEADWTIVAKFEPYHTVCYEVSGEGTVTNTNQTLKHGEDGEESVAEPLSDDYYFVGWFDLDGNPIPVQGNANKHTVYAANDSITIVAKFERLLMLRYVTEGDGTVTNATQRLKIGENGMLAAAEPLDENSYFAGWFDAEGNPLIDGVYKNTHNERNVCNDTVITARFQAFVVIQYVAEGKGTVTNAVQKRMRHENGLESFANANDENSYFVGWFDASGNLVAAVGASNRHQLFDVDESITLVAKFADYLTIRYLTDGAGAVTNQLQKVKQDESGIAAVATPSDAFHYFAGWKVLSGGAWADDLFNHGNTRAETNVTDDVTVLAVFRAYVVLTFATDGNGTLSNPDTQYLEHGESSTEVTATVTDSSTHYFAGWFVSATVTPIANSATFVLTAASENLTVTAKFIEKRTLNYSVYNAGYIEGISAPADKEIGGTIDTKGTKSAQRSIRITHNESGPLVCAVADSGWMFARWEIWNGTVWQTDSIFTGETRQDAAGQNDFTARAVFQMCATVTYTVSGSGTIGGETTQDVRLGGDSTPVMAKPIDADTHYFAGWYTSGESPVLVGTAAVRFEQAVTGDITLVAQFLPYVIVCYTAAADGFITDANGNPKDSYSQKITQDGICAPVIAVADDPDTHYFDGWYIDYDTEASPADFNGADDQNPIRFHDGAEYNGKTLTAVFLPWVTFHFEAASNGTETNGTLEWEPSQWEQKADTETEQKVRQGESVTITAVANSGYSFAYWQLQDESDAWLGDYAQDEALTVSSDEGGITINYRAQFIAGSGNLADQYLISDYESLLSVNRLGIGEKKYFQVVNTIDLSHITDFMPLCPSGFTGELDGTNKAISYLNITEPIEVTTESTEGTILAAGLFAKVIGAAVVKSIRYSHWSITISGKTQDIYAGLIAGYVFGEAQLTGFIRSGSQSSYVEIATSEVAYAGGLFGYVAGSSANSIFVGGNTARDITVISRGSGDFSQSYAGGLIGYGSNIEFDNTNETEDVTITGASGKVGILAGMLVNISSSDIGNHLGEYDAKLTNVSNPDQTEEFSDGLSLGDRKVHSFSFD